MLKKVLAVVLMLFSTLAFALAEVEVNSADQAALDGVKGIGATMSKKILEERKANGNFKDWADLQKRVKGIGDKSSTHFSKAGLRVNGQAKAGASAVASAPAPAAASAPAASAPAASAAAASAKSK
jgi:competence protein ComEA